MAVEHITQRQLFTGSVTANELFTDILVANSFSTVSANVQILDIISYEVSGFNATGPVTIIDTTDAYSALTVTQSGTGYAMLINDSIPDSTPFAIDAAGNVGVGTLAPSQKLSVIGNTLIVGTGTFKSNDDVQNNLRLQRSSNIGRSQISFEDENNNSLWQIGTTSAGSNTFNFLNLFGTHVSIISTGNVGISNTNPTSKLVINGDVLITKSGLAATIDSNAAANALIDFKYNGIREAQFSVTSTGLTLFGDSNATLTFGTVGDTQQLYLKDDGNTGIGTTNAREKLTISGNVSASQTGIFTALSSNDLFVNNLSKPVNLNSHSLTNANIDSGSIDGTTIGGSSSAAGTFTTFTASGVANINANANNNTNINTGTSTGTISIGNVNATLTFAGDTSINASVNDNTNINTGSSTGTVSIGNGAAGAIGITTGSTLTITTGNTVGINTTTGRTTNINTGTGSVITTIGSAGTVAINGSTNINTTTNAATNINTGTGNAATNIATTTNTSALGLGNSSGNTNIAANALGITTAGSVGINTTTGQTTNINTGTGSVTTTIGNDTASNITTINSRSVTAPNQVVDSNSSVITRSTGDTRYGNIVDAQITTNQSFNTTTLTNSNLSITLPDAGFYQFTLFATVSTSASENINFNLAGSGGLVTNAVNLMATYGTSTVASTPASILYTSLTNNTAIAGAANTLFNYSYNGGINATAAGTITLQLATVTNARALNLMAGSFIIARRLA